MNKSIVRTPTRAEGGITAEEKKSLDEHAKLWIERIMKTGYVDKRKITAAIKGLYRVSGKKEPKVIIVPSPYVGQLAGGLAAAILYLRHPAAIDAATDAATDDATAAATRAATYDATAAAIDAATDDATAAATRAATDAATYDATSDATDDATAAATQLLNVIAHFLPSTEFNFVLCCINNIWRLRQGGNMWGMWDSYLTAMRDIIGLSGLDCWDRYKYWEEAAIHGGYRIMHEEFCMVSEFPEFIKTNENRQPHSDNGLSHRWRDGFEIYHLNGVRFPKPLYWRVISGNMPMEEILDITDIDQRYQALRYAKSGLREFFLQQSGKKIDEFIKFDIKKRKISYQLWQVPAGEIFNKDVFFAIYDDPSSIEKSNPKEYCKGVPEFSTVAEAMAWGMSSNEYTLSPEDWKRLTPLTEES